MSDTPDNHTLRLLQEMRKEMQDSRKEMKEMREDLTLRMDGITHIMTLLAGHYHTVEDRLSTLEDRQKG